MCFELRDIKEREEISRKIIKSIWKRKKLNSIPHVRACLTCYGDAMRKGMICFKCGKEKMNVHLCEVQGSNVICDDCCKNYYLKENKCKVRHCPHNKNVLKDQLSNNSSSKSSE